MRSFPTVADAGSSGGVVAIHHVQLAMPPGGETAARDFYAELLGMAEIEKPPTLQGRGGCWFERGPVQVHLGVEPDFRPALRAHPAFVVSDLAALRRRLDGAGHRTVADPLLPGYRRCYVSDPFGNRIELLESERP